MCASSAVFWFIQFAPKSLSPPSSLHSKRSFVGTRPPTLVFTISTDNSAWADWILQDLWRFYVSGLNLPSLAFACGSVSGQQLSQSDIGLPGTLRPSLRTKDPTISSVCFTGWRVETDYNGTVFGNCNKDKRTVFCPPHPPPKKGSVLKPTLSTFHRGKSCRQTFDGNKDQFRATTVNFPCRHLHKGVFRRDPMFYCCNVSNISTKPTGLHKRQGRRAAVKGMFGA